ncbi:hypothetical protein EsH8_X_000452 [Colletotrichum jinshuiense]
MIPSTQYDEAVSSLKLEAMAGIHQAQSFNAKSKGAAPPSQSKTKTKPRELPLVSKHVDSLPSNRSATSVSPVTGRLVQAQSPTTNRPDPATQDAQPTFEAWSLASPTFPCCSGALPVPEIRIKNADTGKKQSNPGGSVSPAIHRQSPSHLQVHDRVRNNNARRRRIELEPDKKNFWYYVDRALGLNKVRTFGDDRTVYGGRLSAKRIVYRIIVLLGLTMLISLLTSSILFVIFGSKGQVGPEWFIWIGISGAGLIWSILAFVMANRQKNKAKFDEEIARQANIINGRIRRGTAVQASVARGARYNNQEAIRAGTVAAAAVAAAVASAPAVPAHPPGLPAVREEEEGEIAIRGTTDLPTELK